MKSGNDRQRKRIVQPAPVYLAEDGPPGLRQPPRPKEYRQKSYESRFDYRTLWYDAFYEESGKAIVAVGPPMLNLKGWFEQGRLLADDGSPLAFQLWEMDRCSSLLADAEGRRHDGLTMQGEGAAFPLTIGPNLAEWFRNRRVLLTKSKDNRLEWIEEWVGHHVRRHGADAVLFYDNESTSCDRETLLETIAAVEGVRVAVVVAWDFPFGPVGIDTRMWDSDFCQHGLLEHARWRFLPQARSVVWCDVDELIVAPQGRSIFRICEESAGGHVSFGGRWIECCRPQASEGASDSEGAREEDAIVRHREHRYLVNDGSVCPPKWAVVPWRVTEDSQWNIHHLNGVRAAFAPLGTGFRHFRGISTSWKYKRAPFSRFDPSVHEFDYVMMEAWREVYREEPLPWMAPEEIALLRFLIRPGDVVLEFGSGRSSHWLAGRARLVHTIEHNERWAANVSEDAPDNLIVHHVAADFPHEGHEPAQPGQFDNYLAAPDRLKVMFDACLVDGRARVDSALRAAPWIRDGGWLFVHDWYKRDRYRERLRELERDYEFRENLSLRSTSQTMAVFCRRARDRERRRADSTGGYHQPAEMPGVPESPRSFRKT